MTDLEINAAIAANVGWKSRTVIVHHSVGYQWDESLTVWTNPAGHDDVLPSYTTDLNAMHQVEMVLDSTNGGPGNPNCLRYRYACEIYRLAPNDIQPFRATARQRAEAFLWTVEKWKEAKL